MNSGKSMIIKKNSALIQVHAKMLSAIQRKIINSLIYTMQKNGPQDSYNITFSTLKKFCNISMIGNNELKESLKGLADIKLEFNYLNKDKNEVWDYMSLLSRVKIVPNEGNIVFEFPDFLRDKLINPRLYAPIDIILIAGFKSSYSIILYELLRDYLTSPSVPIMSIEDFKNLVGIKKNEYKCFNDFKKRVLEVATKEVNEKTDIYCHFELSKERGVGNKYSSIRFFVTKKTGDLTYEKNTELKPKQSGLNGDLFEKLETENKLIIPEEILKEIPEKYKVKSLIDEIIKRISEGKAIDYIGLNLRYAFKKAKENPLYYAINALNKNYAGFDIEIEAKKAKEKKAQSVAVKDNESQKKREEIALDIVRSFPPEKYDALYEKAKELNSKEHPGNPFFIRDSMIEMRMAKIYMENSENNSYQNNDND